MSYSGKWWHKLDDGRIQCDLCPRDCKLNEGQRGFCFVRARENDEMVLTTYGRSSGFCIDPIEKKPLNQFYPGTSVLSFGTAGCNLGCRFCQNWSISKAKEWDRLSDQATPEELAKSAVRLNAKSVAFTYNDPTIFAEYAMDVADACHQVGVKTVAVTAGYIHAEARRELYAKMDAANIDLKGFTEDFYREQCLGHLQPVLETLEYVAKETKTWLEVTTLLIPGKNDSDAELAKLCEWFAAHVGTEVPLHFTAFHPDFKLVDVAHTPLATLRRARAHALAAGLKYVYTGNLPDLEGSTTYCPACREKVIVRAGYDVTEFSLKGGKCTSCGAAVAGHYEDVAGTFGTRRVRVRLSEAR